MTGTKARPSPEALFQLAALWTAKRVRGRIRNTGANDAEFYSEFFTDEDDQIFGWDPRTRHRTETVRATLLSNVPKGSCVLDVGCGLGDVLEGLVDEYSCFGIDFAESNVKRATRRLKNKAVLKQGSAYALPFDDASMDAIISLEVLEHLEDDRAALLEMLRVLRPDGSLLLAVPYTYYWSSYLELMGHYRHYTRESFTKLLAGVSLEVERYLPNYPRWHQSFTRGFVGIKALYVLAQKLGLYRGSIRDFNLLPNRPSMIEELERLLESTLRSEANANYAALPTSTFVLARRTR
jgi:ubiquinone/menaquinone biosynthesis C-methylase UbiE